MDSWQIWLIAGLVMMILELIVPGGVVVFLGVSAIIVGAGLYFKIISTVTMSFIVWFMTSIFMMLVLRSFFMKYFEGDSKVHNVDENADFKGSIVLVVEEISPYKEGRVRFRDTTWIARSDDELARGEEAIIVEIDENSIVVEKL